MREGELQFMSNDSVPPRSVIARLKFEKWGAHGFAFSGATIIFA